MCIWCFTLSCMKTYRIFRKLCCLSHPFQLEYFTFLIELSAIPEVAINSLLYFTLVGEKMMLIASVLFQALARWKYCNWLYLFLYCIFSISLQMTTIHVIQFRLSMCLSVCLLAFLGFTIPRIPSIWQGEERFEKWSRCLFRMINFVKILKGYPLKQYFS